MEGEQKMEVERAWETVPAWPVCAHAPWVCASHGQRGSPGEAAGWIPARSEGPGSAGGGQVAQMGLSGEWAGRTGAPVGRAGHIWGEEASAASFLPLGPPDTGKGHRAGGRPAAGGVPATPRSSPAALLAEAVTFLPDPELSNPHRKRTPQPRLSASSGRGRGGCQAGSPARPLGQACTATGVFRG